MTTNLRRLPFVNPDSVGLPGMPLSQDEIDLMNAIDLLHWWDAGHGFDADGWRCRKTGAILVQEKTNMPALQLALAAYNGAPSLLFTDGNRQLWDNGENLFPTGEFTLAVVGRPGPNDNAFIAGAATIGQTATTRFIASGADASDGSSNILVNDGSTTGAQLGLTAVSHKFADGPALVEMSNRPQPLASAGNQTAIRRLLVSTGVISGIEGDTLGGEVPNAHREFHVGGVNPYGSATGGALQGGDIGSIFIFSTALHFDSSLRDLFERVVRARYAIPVA